ncbi:MAG: diadenylate cyclase CdaA [Firmicutes bacterium]|nr:diadenylate cyclase CdaA [Dethiobacter sp.]MBS3889553.1 diadenylate cyclase CdaA [Bacillota bacterium]MBS4053605.1 diadenylate cyclase CdaA [Thermaerobacter sp.]
MWATLEQILLEVRILDLLEIAILYYVFYRLILLLRHTRAVQLIKGVVVLLGATLLSDSLRLTTLNWILSRAISALFIAIPLLFWPELRRALEHLGRTKFLGKGFSLMTATDQTPVAAAIAQAAGALSKSSTGALIIIERESGLSEYSDTGVRIDAVVTPELLFNIFVPNTPLHDGAVIIRQGRLSAAGCYLPLSSNPEIEQELGTRHRAALGLTEETDALAVVVSEETGSISLAQGGELARHLDLAELERRLHAALPATQATSIFSWGARV